jgi:hypothetical protein
MLCVLICVFLYGSIACAGVPLWGGLKPGPHGIGFRTVEKYDWSRTYGEKMDYFGAPMPGETARPIQICIWYPAVTTGNETAMVYGEYAYPFPEDDSFHDLLANLQARETQLIQGLTGGDHGFVMDLINVEMAAVRDATPAEGSFPLLIYHPNIESSYCDNFILCEYLASHGFIVATTHPLGTSRFTPGLDQADIETVIGDREFVAAYMHQYPHVDTSKLGLFGFGSGGFTALLTQMRNSRVDAVADLGGSLVFPDVLDTIRQNPYYNEMRMQVPVMELHNNVDFAPDLSLIDALRYGPRYRYLVSGQQYFGFCSIGNIRNLMPDSTGAVSNVSNPGHEAVCRYVMNFFKAHLNDDAESSRFLSNEPTVNGFAPGLVEFSFQAAEDAPPTDRQFMQIISDYGASKAAEVFEKFRQSHPGSITFPEATMNFLGYDQLGSGKPDQAVILFKMNAEVYPNSANCWDSYADGCVAAGDTDGAIMCYKKVLEVLPNDPNANESLKETLRNNAEAGLERLQR